MVIQLGQWSKNGKCSKMFTLVSQASEIGYLSKEAKSYFKISAKLKVTLTIFGWSWSKIGVAFY